MVEGNETEKVTSVKVVAVSLCCFPVLPKKVRRVERQGNRLTKRPGLCHKKADSIHPAVLLFGNIGSADRLVCPNLPCSWEFPGFNLR